MQTSEPALIAVNRLRARERDGQVLLRRPLMEPMGVSEFSEQLPGCSSGQPLTQTPRPMLVQAASGRAGGFRAGASTSTSSFSSAAVVVVNECNGTDVNYNQQPSASQKLLQHRAGPSHSAYNEMPSNVVVDVDDDDDDVDGRRRRVDAVVQQQPGGSRRRDDDNVAVANGVGAMGGASGGGGDDTDMEDELGHMPYTCKQLIVPSKSQVLFYVSTSTLLRLNHTGSELQVSDPSDFPLLDIWAESVCDEAPVWIIESYGRRVAVVTDVTPRSLLNLLPFVRPRRPGQAGYQVIDWNGDVIGYYCLGDPIEIQDTRREPIARCYCESESGDAWRVTCEANSSRQLARLDAGGALHFATDLALPLKILVIATLSRAVARRGSTRTSCFPLLFR